MPGNAVPAAALPDTSVAPTTGPALHVLTCEYPPMFGGVADYTAILANELAQRGVTVDVWAPGTSGTVTESERIRVHRTLGTFRSADLKRTNQALDALPGPRTLCVQWVPHGYGKRAMNVGVCRWLARRATQHGDRIALMIHEPFLPFAGQRVRVRAASLVQRWMMRILLRCATEIWVATDAWTARLQPLSRPGQTIRWLPVPSNVPVVADDARVAAVRALAPDITHGGILVGHFGTYGTPTRSTIEAFVPAFLHRLPDAHMLLLGRDSEIVASSLREAHPSFAARLHGAGEMGADDLSVHLQACDLMVQPYPDGVTTRRGSAMAALAHGRPIVTTQGELTESLWATAQAALLVPTQEPRAMLDAVVRLATDADLRARLGRNALTLYSKSFSPERTAQQLEHLCGLGTHA